MYKCLKSLSLFTEQKHIQNTILMQQRIILCHLSNIWNVLNQFPLVIRCGFQEKVSIIQKPFRDTI